MLKVTLHAWVGGTSTTTGSATTLADTSRDEPDDTFQNTSPQSRIHITSTTDGQAPLGYDRLITDFANTGGIITFPTMTTAPAPGDKYLITSEYPWVEMVEALNAAIDGLAPFNLYDHVDETNLVIQTGVEEYPIPPEFAYLYQITQADGTGDFADPIPPNEYRILHTTPPRIKFLTMPTVALSDGHWHGSLWVSNSLVAGRYLRLEGLARQAPLVNEQDVCYMNPNYLINYAASMLHSARIVQTASDFDNNVARAKQTMLFAQSILNDARFRLPPNAKKVER